MKLTAKHSLILILVLASFLRFYNFTKTDVFTDEALLGIRSLGLIDFSPSLSQTTPWQWVAEVPPWLHLSMHDHPILVFLLQHLSFQIFGNNTFGLRLPSLLAGVLSVCLIYLIGKKIFNEKTGLVAAFILSITPYHLWVSRAGLQEALVILFILLAFYYFLKSLGQTKYLLLVALFLGLGIEIKYTSFVLLPLLLLLTIYERKIKAFITAKYFWLGLILFLIIVSPSIIYNLKMQQTFGHLDFQLSDIFQQNVPEWQIHYGRELVGSLTQRISRLPIALKDGFSWPALALFVASFLLLIWSWLKNKTSTPVIPTKVGIQSKTPKFILITLVLVQILWLLVIGPTRRFMSYLTPFMALTLGWAIIFIYQKISNLNSRHYVKKNFITFLVILVIFEIFFTLNTFYFFRPKGQEGIFWAKVHYEIKNWGFNSLDIYLSKITQNKAPFVSFPTRHDFLKNIKDKALREMKNKKYEPLPVLFIYDTNIFDLASVWLFHRRAIYGGWPILDAKTYLETLKTEGADTFQKKGVQYFYFILPTQATLLENKRPLNNFGGQLENALLKNNIKPDKITGGSEEVFFKVYKF